MSKLDLSSLGGVSNSVANEQRREKNAQVERVNLLNLVKLSIKALIESFMELRQQITDGQRELEQFFVILEDILKHRIRNKRNMLGTKREFLGESFFSDSCPGGFVGLYTDIPTGLYFEFSHRGTCLIPNTFGSDRLQIKTLKGTGLHSLSPKVPAEIPG